MAPKAKKSSRGGRKAGAKSKKGVSIEMVKGALVALGERNGSSIKSIFNYLVRNKKVSQSSRTLVILALGRGVRDGTFAKKTPNTFIVNAGGKKKPAAIRRRKRKTRRTKRSRKTSVKKSTKRRRRQRKRKNQKKSRKSTKRRSRKNVKRTQKKRTARRSRKTKKTINKPVQARTSKRPMRRAARNKSYRQFY